MSADFPEGSSGQAENAAVVSQPSMTLLHCYCSPDGTLRVRLQKGVPAPLLRQLARELMQSAEAVEHSPGGMH